MSDRIGTNKALMRRIYDEVWNRGNPAQAAEIFAQPEGVERFVKEFLTYFPDLQHTVEGMVAEGDEIAEHHTWWDKAGLLEQIGQ